MLKIAIPNKGRLHEPSISLFEAAGLPLQDRTARKLFAKTNDPEITILFVRASDIPEYVQDGAADMGVTGLDLISETNSKVKVILDLEFGMANLVLAVSDNSEIKTIKDLENKRVATEFPNIAKKYFKDNGVSVEIVRVSGACEITPHIGVADAIIDISSSGTTLITNRLRVVEKVFSSSVKLIANHDSVKNNNKIRHICMAFESVLNARNKRYLMMNIPKHALDEIKKILPSLSGPTVMEVESNDMLAIHVVIDSDKILSVVGDLKKVGASGILITPIERIIP